jgi:dUTP pyrophosphatase
MQDFKYVDVSSHGQPNLIKNHYADAGLDIRSNEYIHIPPKESRLIETGVKIQIKEGYVGLIWSRSGLSVKHGLEVGAGCIDASYRGEIKIHLFNHSYTPVEVIKGDKIAQLLTIPIHAGLYTLTQELDETIRGGNGFGSTG